MVSFLYDLGSISFHVFILSSMFLTGLMVSFMNIQNDVLLMVLMVTIFAIIIVSILVGIIFKKRMDAEKLSKGSGA